MWKQANLRRDIQEADHETEVCRTSEAYEIEVKITKLYLLIDVIGLY